MACKPLLRDIVDLLNNAKGVNLELICQGPLKRINGFFTNLYKCRTPLIDR